MHPSTRISEEMMVMVTGNHKKCSFVDPTGEGEESPFFVSKFLVSLLVRVRKAGFCDTA